MDKFTEVVINYINMRSTGALLITGDWGSGKTFYLKNKVFKKIEEDTGRLPIIVSLFGEADKGNLGQKVMFAYLDKLGKEAKLSTSFVAKSLKHIVESFPKLKEYVDVEKLTIGSGENLFRILPHDKLVMVFDDIERMSGDLPVDEFLGIVNDLVENNGCKVLLVANEAEIKNGISFKEKTIEKTFHFIPDIKVVFDSIINSYKKSLFKEFIKEHEDFFFNSIDLTSIGNREIRRSYSNIRTLKFALEHFRYVFELFPQKEDHFNHSLVITQLKNIWYFIIAISIEFRKSNNLTFTERKGLDAQPLTLFDLDSFVINDSILIDELDEKSSINETGFFEKFRKIYYDRFNEKYLYHDSVYDLITGGVKIEKKPFREELEKNYHVKDGDIPPAHKILDRIQHEGYWSFTNEEFVKSLNDLMSYCEHGQLNNLISYINASTFLFGFSNLISKTDDEISNGLIKGVDFFISKEKLSTTLLDQREMIGYQYRENENIQRIIDHVELRIKELEELAAKDNAKRIDSLFENNIQSFVKEFAPETTLALSTDGSILHNLKAEAVFKAVPSWSPKEVMLMYSLLKRRYINSSSSDQRKDEILFLKNLQEGIGRIDLKSPLLSNKVIISHLSPILEQSIAALEGEQEDDYSDIIEKE